MSKSISLAPIEVQNAFAHVRSFFPDVVSVSFDEDCRWSYETVGGYSPDFDDHDIDQDILEAAADAQYNIMVPVEYIADCFIEIELARSTVKDKPTIVLTQIDEELWDVTVGEGAATTWETLESAVCEYTDSIREYQFKVSRSA